MASSKNHGRKPKGNADGKPSAAATAATTSSSGGGGGGASKGSRMLTWVVVIALIGVSAALAVTCTQLNEQITKERKLHEEEIQKLEEDLSSLRTDITVSATERLEALAKTSNLQRDLVAQKEECKANLKAELTEMEAKNHRLRSDLKDQQKAAEEMKRHTFELESKLQDRDRQVASNQEADQLVKTQLSDLQLVTADMETKLQEKEVELAASKKTTREKDEELIRLQEVTATLRDQLKDEQEKHKEQKEIGVSLENALKSHTERAESLEQMLKTKEEEQEKAEEKIAQLEQELPLMSSKLQEAHELVAKHEEMEKGLKGQVEKLTSKANEKSEKVKELENVVDLVKKAFKEKDVELADCIVAERVCQDGIAKFKRIAKDISNGKRIVDDELISVSLKVKELEKTEQESRQEMTIKTSLLEAAQASAKALEERISQLVAAQSEDEKTKSDLAGEVSRLETLTGNLEARLQASDEASATEKARLNEQLQKNLEKLQEKEEALKKLMVIVRDKESKILELQAQAAKTASKPKKQQPAADEKKQGR